MSGKLGKIVRRRIHCSFCKHGAQLGRQNFNQGFASVVRLQRVQCWRVTCVNFLLEAASTGCCRSFDNRCRWQTRQQ